MPASGPSCCRRCSKRRSSPRRSGCPRPRGRQRALRRGADYFPAVDEFTSAADCYLELLEDTKKAVEVPVIASLNASLERRLDPLRQPARGGRRRRPRAERLPAPHRPPAQRGAGRGADLALVSNVCDAVSLPVAVKLLPVLLGHGDFAAKVVAAGAAGLVLFNRFYQPDLDLETMDVVPRVELSPAGSCACRCAGSPSCAPSSARPVPCRQLGVYSGYDVVKALAVGADVAMMTSAPSISARACQTRRIRTALLAGGPRVHLGGRAARLGLPGDLDRGERLRAGELPEDTCTLGPRLRAFRSPVCRSPVSSTGFVEAPSASSVYLLWRRRAGCAGRLIGGDEMSGRQRWQTSNKPGRRQAS